MPSSRLPWIFAAAAFACALAPIWWGPRDIWDSLIGTYGLATGDFHGIYEWTVPGNWGLVYLQYRLMDLLSRTTAVPPWVWAKLIMTASLVGIAFETRRLCVDVLGWKTDEGLAAAALVLAFPCWYLLYSNTFVYLTFVWWVFLGHRWLHADGRPGRQLAGFLLMLASFQVNSNFVMVFALEGARYLCRPAGSRWRAGRSLAVMGSAVAVYLLLRFVFTPSGVYVGYNNLLSPFSRQGLIAVLRPLLMFLTWLVLIAAPALLAMVAVRGIPRGDPAAGDRQGRRYAAVALWLAGALSAYVAVGKGSPLFVLNLPIDWLGTASHVGQRRLEWLYTPVDGWSARHVFLFSVPAAIAAVLGLRSVLGAQWSETPRGRRAWWSCLGAALVFWLGWTLHGHAAKQTRLAQEEAIVRGLREIPPPGEGRVDLPIDGPVGWSTTSTESNYWLWQAYGKARWASASYTEDPEQRAAAIRDREHTLSEAALPPSYFLMESREAPCASTYAVTLPKGLDGGSWLADRLGLARIPPARIALRSSVCPAAAAAPGRS